MNLSLEQTLASILQSLADFFGVTTQTIMENAPMWLAKYGWYVTIKDLGLTIFIGGFIGIALVGGLFFIFYIMLDADYKKWHSAMFITIAILAIIITIFIPIITCIIAPEYVGIEALLRLLQS